jgi:OOP family OmpA-OmpF porin
MNVKLAAALTVLTLAMLPAAYAQDEEAGAYFGAGIGQFDAGIDNIDDVDATVDDWDDDDSAYKIFGGFQFSRFLAAEIAYIDLGNPSGEVVPGVNVDAEVDGFAPYVVASFPIGPWFEVYARAGYYFYDATLGVEDAVGGDVEFDEESEDFVYGGGVGARLMERLALRLEYEKFDLEGVDDADALWLTAAWKF